MDTFDLGVEAVNTHRDRPLVSLLFFLLFFTNVIVIVAVMCVVHQSVTCHDKKTV